jgi:ubiquinone/menaquinone biosynthesis C-methylase UbiE
MPKIEAFEKYAGQYEEWFERNRDLYRAELKAVQELMPFFDKGLEIGVGTGRFAAPLNIKFGMEPSPKMAERAEQRGIRVIEGTAEELPFTDEEFDLVLMVTTICFVDDIPQSFREAFRVLQKDGHFLLGLIDKDSYLGRKYQIRRDRSRFYREAVFVSAREILKEMRKTGFGALEIRQALLPDEPPDVIKNGAGIGSFAVVRGQKNVRTHEKRKNQPLDP